MAVMMAYLHGTHSSVSVFFGKATQEPGTAPLKTILAFQYHGVVAEAL
jgi:hypothetical protein